jgi:hypothetical protein
VVPPPQTMSAQGEAGAFEEHPHRSAKTIPNRRITPS